MDSSATSHRFLRSDGRLQDQSSCAEIIFSAKAKGRQLAIAMAKMLKIPISFVSVSQSAESIDTRLRFCVRVNAPISLSVSQAYSLTLSIDGVLVRSNDPLPRAHKALSYLQSQRIPFILLTNGGGKRESERVADLSAKLGVPLSGDMFVQSHTPFADFDHLKDKTILVIGGDEDLCRKVALQYGFKTVVNPGDIFTAHPEIWPLSDVFREYYAKFARPLPRPILPTNPSRSLKIDAMFVYNDPRDWGLDATIILDALLSSQGILGTISPLNGNESLPNRGFQQDGQPPLYYSNPDLWWAAKYHLPRLGQGGFREAFEGLWTAVTGGESKGVKLQKEIIGKPYYKTYEFAEKKLHAYRQTMFPGHDDHALKKVYMVGDNPESDIRGGNSYDSPFGSKWRTVLVRTGVYQHGEPSWRPNIVVEDVYDAVQWAIDDAK